MAEDEEMDSPLDDDLLRELGLEPKAKPKPAAAAAQPKPDVSRPAPQAAPAPAPKAPAPRAPVPPPDVPAKRAPEPAAASAKGLTQNMPIQVVAVLGKKTMTLKEVASVKQGEILDFQKIPQDGVDLVANGKLIARGELVLVDGKVGIQIKQLLG